MENNKKIIIYVLITLSIIIGTTFVFINSKIKREEQIEETKNKIEQNKYDNKKRSKENQEILEFLEVISGMKLENVEIINSPVGIYGEFLAPREAILKGVDYFLENTQNDKIENIKVDIGENFINLSVDYIVNEDIKTPVSIKVNPSVDENKNLVINIEEIKFLDLKIADWIVNLVTNNIDKDMFSSNSNLDIGFKKGKVIIYKSNFEGATLEEIKIEKDGLGIKMNIDLEQIL